jgi:catechol 2,3-dioxygenase-like lactoylglutathione lyase family enzyme
MAIELDHTIVPARDKVQSARFFARIFGVRFDEAAKGHFAPVHVNDTLILDFTNNASPSSHHYAFRIGEAEFDAIFARLQAEGVPYGSGPFARDDMTIDERGGGRRVYFDDPNGHVLEILTVPWERETAGNG